jgi:hypothetical protein
MQPTAKLTLEQALTYIKNVISIYKGTLQEHQVLQQSLQIVIEATQKPVMHFEEKDIVKD